jgi:hypothetical protein
MSDSDDDAPSSPPSASNSHPTPDELFSLLYPDGPEVTFSLRHDHPSNSRVYLTSSFLTDKTLPASDPSRQLHPNFRTKMLVPLVTKLLNGSKFLSDADAASLVTKITTHPEYISIVYVGTDDHVRPATFANYITKLLYISVLAPSAATMKFEINLGKVHPFDFTPSVSDPPSTSLPSSTTLLSDPTATLTSSLRPTTRRLLSPTLLSRDRPLVSPLATVTPSPPYGTGLASSYVLKGGYIVSPPQFTQPNVPLDPDEFQERNPTGNLFTSPAGTGQSSFTPVSISSSIPRSPTNVTFRSADESDQPSPATRPILPTIPTPRLARDCIDDMIHFSNKIYLRSEITRSLDLVESSWRFNHLRSRRIGDSTFAAIGPWRAERDGTLRICWPTQLPLFVPSREEYFLSFPMKTQRDLRDSRFVRYFVFPSFSRFQNAFEWYVACTQACRQDGVFLPPIHTLDRDYAQGSWSPELPDYLVEHVDTHAFLIQHALTDKESGLNSRSTDPALRSIVSDLTHSGYHMMRMIMRHAGHPSLRDSGHVTIEIPVQRSDDSMEDYTRRWRTHLHVRALSGDVLSDRFFLLQFMDMMQGAPKLALVPALHRAIDRCSADDPLPLSLQPGHLLQFLSDTADFMKTPSALLAVTSSRPSHPGVHALVTSSDPMLVHAVGAPTGGPPRCHFCQSPTHKIYACPAAIRCRDNSDCLRFLTAPPRPAPLHTRQVVTFDDDSPPDDDTPSDEDSAAEADDLSLPVPDFQ